MSEEDFEPVPIEINPEPADPGEPEPTDPEPPAGEDPPQGG